jgi:hypothetical protein
LTHSSIARLELYHFLNGLILCSREYSSEKSKSFYYTLSSELDTFSGQQRI